MGKEIVGEKEIGSKRHLPPWLLLRNSSETEEGKAEGATVAADADDDDDDDDDDHQKETQTQSSRITECTVVKRRRRKLIDQHSGAVADADATRKAEKKRDDSSNKTPRPPSPPIHHHHHVELTMEDLLAIAHEYVNDEKKKKKQKEATSGQSESLNQFIKTVEYADSPDSHSQRQTSSTSEWEGLYSSTSNNTTHSLPTTTSQTADPAQQMLDILLGPLLKPLQKEKEKNKSIIDSVEFTQEIPGKDLLQLSGEDKAPLTKRKYSLKDKVGLFLD